MEPSYFLRLVVINSNMLIFLLPLLNRSYHKTFSKFLINMFHKHLTIEELCTKGYLNSIKLFNYNYESSHADIATKNGELGIVKYLFSKGIKCSNLALKHVVEKGDFPMVSHLANKQKLFCDKHSVNVAAGKGYLRIVKFYHKRKLDVSPKGLLKAVEHNRLNVVKYCSNFIELEKTSADIAANNGYLEMTKFLVKKGLKPSSNSLEIAIRNESKDMVEYLISINVML